MKNLHVELYRFRGAFASVAISAVALLGASSSAHAAPIPALADVTAESLTLGDSSSVTVTDTAKAGQYSVYVSTNDFNSGNTNAGNAVKGGTAFAAAVDFTLASGNGVSWLADGADPTKFSNVTYKLISGSPSQGSTTYGSLPVLDSGAAFTLAGLTVGDSYALLIQGVSLIGSGNATLTGTLSAVPLPGALVMFGSALVGLTALGARRRSAISA